MVATRRQARDLDQFRNVDRPPASLLGLGFDMLVAILSFLPQQDLLASAPLVCKQLHALLKRASDVWRECHFTLSAEAPKSEEHETVVLNWFRARQGSIEKLSLDLPNPAWFQTAGLIVTLNRSSLRTLWLASDPAMDEDGNIGHMQPDYELLLGPLQHATQLTFLDVILDCDSGPAQQPGHACSLSALTGLKYLWWKVEGQQAPQGTEALTALTSLNLSPVSNVPAGYSQLGSLQSLQLHFSGTSQQGRLSDVMGCLTALSSLCLESAAPEAMQATSWSSLRQLQSIELRDCELTALPLQFSALTNLTELMLSDCNFEEEGSLDGLQHLTALQELTLERAALAHFPTQLAGLTSLTWLSLADNDELSLSISNVRLLASLKALRKADLTDVDCSRVSPAAWLALARARYDLNVISLLYHSDSDSDDEWL